MKENINFWSHSGHEQLPIHAPTSSQGRMFLLFILLHVASSFATVIIKTATRGPSRTTNVNMGWISCFQSQPFWWGRIGLSTGRRDTDTADNCGWESRSFIQISDVTLHRATISSHVVDILNLEWGQQTLRGVCASFTHSAAAVTTVHVTVH